MFNVIIKNLKVLIASQVISQIFGFFTVVYLARTIGANNFGIIVFAQAIMSYFGIVTDLGVTRVGTREISKDHDNIEKYAGNIIGLRLILTLISFCALTIFVLMSNKGETTKLVVILFSLSLLANSVLIDWIFKGIELMQHIAISNSIERISYFILVMTLIDNDSPIVAIPIIFLVGNAIASLYLLYIYKYRLRFKLKITLELNLLKKLIIISLPLALSTFMVRINNNADTLLLSTLSSDEVVGYYNAAYKIILVIFMVGGFYVTTIFPSICRYYKNGNNELQVLLKNSVRVLALLGIPMACGGIVLAENIIQTIYGSAYLPATAAFKVLCLYIPISFISMIYADTLVACDMQKEYAIGMVVSGITNISINLALIPLYGMVGAAIATCASELVLLMFSYAKIKKIVSVPFIDVVDVPIISSVLMCIPLNFVQAPLYILIPLGMSLYIACLIIFKGITFSEVLTLKNLLLNKI